MHSYGLCSVCSYAFPWWCWQDWWNVRCLNSNVRSWKIYRRESPRLARYSEALALSDSNTHNLCTGCQLLNSGWRLQIKSINKAPCSSIKLMSLQKEGKGRETDALFYSSASYVRNIYNIVQLCWPLFLDIASASNRVSKGKHHSCDPYEPYGPMGPMGRSCVASAKPRVEGVGSWHHVSLAQHLAVHALLGPHNVGVFLQEIDFNWKYRNSPLDIAWHCWFIEFLNLLFGACPPVHAHVRSAHQCRCPCLRPLFQSGRSQKDQKADGPLGFPIRELGYFSSRTLLSIWIHLEFVASHVRRVFSSPLALSLTSL